MKPSLVPEALHLPSAVDILTVIKRYFMQRLCKIEADDLMFGFYTFTWCWNVPLLISRFALPDAALHTPANLCQVYIAFAVLNCSYLIQSRAGRLRLLGGDSGVVLPAIGPLSGPAPHFQLS